MWDDLVELALELLDLVLSCFEFKGRKKNKGTANSEEPEDAEKR